MIVDESNVRGKAHFIPVQLEMAVSVEGRDSSFTALTATYSNWTSNDEVTHTLSQARTQQSTIQCLMQLTYMNCRSHRKWLVCTACQPGGVVCSRSL
jgi:hypothetical protein